MKIQVKGEIQEPNGDERFKAVTAKNKQEQGDDISPEEAAVINQVERFDRVMSRVADLVTEGLMIEMKP